MAHSHVVTSSRADSVSVNPTCASAGRHFGRLACHLWIDCAPRGESRDRFGYVRALAQSDRFVLGHVFDAAVMPELIERHSRPFSKFLDRLGPDDARVAIKQGVDDAERLLDFEARPEAKSVALPPRKT